MTPRLKSDFWVNALVRRAQSMGGYATVLRKGDPDAGIALVILRATRNLTLYAPERNFTGERVWWPESFQSQMELDTRLNRRIDDDPDIWVVEIESEASAKQLIGEPIEGLTDDFNPEQAAAQAAAKALFQGK
jgi:hypothetical protein